MTLNRPQECTPLVNPFEQYPFDTPQEVFGPGNSGVGPPPPGSITEEYETSVGVTGNIEYENPASTFGLIDVVVS